MSSRILVDDVVEKTSGHGVQMTQDMSFRLYALQTSDADVALTGDEVTTQTTGLEISINTTTSTSNRAYWFSSIRSFLLALRPIGM